MTSRRNSFKEKEALNSLSSSSVTPIKKFEMNTPIQSVPFTSGKKRDEMQAQKSAELLKQMGNLNRKLDLLCSIKASFQLTETLNTEQSETVDLEKYETERQRSQTPIKSHPPRELSHSSQKTLKKSVSSKRKQSVSPMKTPQQKMLEKQNSAIKQHA